MKIVRWAVAFTAGLLLWMFALAAFDVPADLPLWRWVAGICLLGAAISVWDRWA